MKKVDKKYKLEGDMDYQVADGQSCAAARLLRLLAGRARPGIGGSRRG